MAIVVKYKKDVDWYTCLNDVALFHHFLHWLVIILYRMGICIRDPVGPGSPIYFTPEVSVLIFN